MAQPMLLISQSEYERLTKEPPIVKRSIEETPPLCEDNSQFQPAVINNNLEKSLESNTVPESVVINKAAEILSPIDRLPLADPPIEKKTKPKSSYKKKKLVPRKKKPREENNSPLHSNLWETW